MKKLAILFLPFLLLISCTGEGSTDGEEAGKYFIKLGESYSETVSASNTGDAFSDEAIFTVGVASLHLFEFHNLSKASPLNVESKSFGAIIEFEKSVEGTASITNVVSIGENSLGENFDIEGFFEGKNGEEGSFLVRMEHIR